MIEPYLPQSAAKIISLLGFSPMDNISWKDIGRAEGISSVVTIKAEVLFSKLENDLVDNLRDRYSGSQKERQEEAAAGVPESKPAATFEETVDLRVAKIEKVERHPKADKLYVIGLETGEGVTGNREERTIVSGLVDFYTEEQLLGKNIIVAYNLKPAKLRGVESRGMLLAAGDNNGTGPDGKPAERCEVLNAGDAPTGTRFLPEEANVLPAPAEINIDTFFSYPITVKDFTVQFNGRNLCLNGQPVRTSIISDGKVG